jgi:hypothetical protein
VANRDAAIGEGLEIRIEISGLRFCVNESRLAMSQTGWNAMWTNNPGRAKSKSSCGWDNNNECES